MTDEQIERALECCDGYNCCGCPYLSSCHQGVPMVGDALTLIKRLKEEKEEQFRRLGKEICAHCSKIVDLQERLAFERAEAIREFAERVKEYYSESKYLPTKEHPVRHTMIVYLFRVLDQIARQMTEE